jgi:hypothetical protein
MLTLSGGRQGETGSERWTVVGVSTAVNALAWGARSTFALFYVAMLEEFAWGRGPTALGYSLSWLGFVVFAPVAGWLSDRWGTRTVVTGGGVILGVDLALTGQVTSLAQYYLCFGVLGAAGIAGMLIPSTTIVTRWFVRSRVLQKRHSELSRSAGWEDAPLVVRHEGLFALLDRTTALFASHCLIHSRISHLRGERRDFLSRPHGDPRSPLPSLESPLQAKVPSPRQLSDFDVDRDLSGERARSGDCESPAILLSAPDIQLRPAEGPVVPRTSS